MSYQKLIDGSCEVFYDVIPTRKKPRVPKSENPETARLRAELKRVRCERAMKAKLEKKWQDWGKAILTR